MSVDSRWIAVVWLFLFTGIALARESGEKRVPVVRSTAQVEIPRVTLVRADGAKVGFAEEIDHGGPVILNFIYTSCSAICPVMSQNFTAVQARLGPAQDRVRLVSISIDPEQDTPAQLRAYAARYQATAAWRFYSGTPQTSVALQRAFGIYRGDKMAHPPVTFLRRAPGEPWIRLDGFATPDEILRETRVWVATQ